jgi:hypothetical protein
MFTGLRVAIVHDWLQGFHGSERVVAAMAEDVFESADVVDIHTLRRVREREWDPHALRERAWMFSRERFVERFSDHVAGVLNGDREPVPL